MLRPDFRTTGGEINDIVVKGRFAGTLTLVYREKERITGSLQLDKDSLKPLDKRRVVRVVQNYVQSLIDAYQVKECDVIATYSPYDHIIATEEQAGVIEEFIEEDPEEMYAVESETGRGARRRAKRRRNTEQAEYYELVIVGENRNRVEYHIYGKDQQWVAEAFMTIHGPEVAGEVNWRFDPDEEQIAHVTDLIISDFDDQEIDSFSIEMKYDGQTVEQIELTHEDMLELDEAAEQMHQENRRRWHRTDDMYSAVLARDDGDTLSYDIYRQDNGSFPCGTATIDIRGRQVSGFIDLRDPGSREDREQIATALIREIDKEREFDTFNLTMMHKNKPVDEVLFEMDMVH
jgi:hypothetical protein